MTTAELTVPATRGHSYYITRDDRGIVRLRRQVVSSGKAITMVFSEVDVINVVNGLVDILEAGR